MKKQLFLTLLFICIFSISNAFTKNSDSLIEASKSLQGKQKIIVLNKISNSLINVDPLQAIKYATEAYKLSKSIRDRKEEAISLINIAYANEDIGNYKIAIYNYEIALDIVTDLKIDYLNANILNYLGYSYKALGIYDFALKYFSSALDKYEQIKDKDGIAIAYNNIGVIYTKTKDYDKSIEYYQKALSLFLEIDSFEDISSIFNNIGLSNYYKKEYDKALEYFDYVLEYLNKYPDNYTLGACFHNIGNVYKAKKDYKKAIAYYNKALEVKINLKSPQLLVITLLGLGETYFYLEQYEQALEFLNQGMDITESQNLRPLKVNLYDFISRTYLKKGNSIKAQEFLSLYSILKDSIDIEDKTKMITNLQVKFDVENKMKEIAFQKDKIKEQNYFIVVLILAFILLVFLVIVIYNRYLLKKRTNKQLIESEIMLTNLNNTKDKFFSIIAHDLKNPLGNFKNLSEVLYESQNELSNEEREEFLGLMKDSAKDIYNLLENLLVWSRSQRGLIGFDPVEFDISSIANITIQTLKLSAENKKIKLFNNIPKLTNIIADPNMIQTVIRNLISNAIKFTPENGNILVDAKFQTSGGLKHSEGSISIYIKDNGIGMSSETINKLFRIDTQVTSKGTNDETGSGLGLILCKEFVEKHGGKIWAESEEGRGSTFYFTIPIIEKKRE